MMLDDVKKALEWLCIVGAALMVVSCFLPWIGGESAVGSYNYLVLIMSLAVAVEAASDVALRKVPIPALLLIGAIVNLAFAAQSIVIAGVYGLVAGYGAAVCVVGAALVLAGSLAFVAKRRA